MKRKGVLFDLDGVLVLTERLKGKAHVQTIENFDGKASITLYQKLMGKSHEEVRSGFISASDITNIDSQEYDHIFEKIYTSFLQTKIEINPGIQSLLKRLTDNDYLLAVVSSSPKYILDFILERTELTQFFSVTISSNDVTNKKPNPEPYIAALKLLSLNASSGIVIEDSESGLESATNAGIRAIGFKHSFNLNHNLGLAIRIFETCNDFNLIFNTIEFILDDKY